MHKDEPAMWSQQVKRPVTTMSSSRLNCRAKAVLRWKVDSLTIRFSRFGRGDQTDGRSEMLCNNFYA